MPDSSQFAKWMPTFRFGQSAKYKRIYYYFGIWPANSQCARQSRANSRIVQENVVKATSFAGLSNGLHSCVTCWSYKRL